MDLDIRIKNIEEYYSNFDNLEDDEQPYAETLKQEEWMVMDNYGRKKKGKNSKLLSHVEHLEEAYSSKASTFVQDLEEDGVNSVKGVACKKQTMVKVSTRYISSKLLINAKISLASFIYDCIGTFCFPNEETSLIYTCHKIIKVLTYLLMTNTDDLGSLEFMVITKDSCDCGDREMRDILFRIFLDNNIQHRLHLSGEFFAQFNKRNEAVRKQIGLCEFENVESGIICAICVNPKEYFELHEYIMKPTGNTRTRERVPRA